MTYEPSHILTRDCFQALSIAGIICEHYGVLCQSGPWSFKTAHAYISVIDFLSITYVNNTRSISRCIIYLRVSAQRCPVWTTAILRADEG